MEEDKKSSSLAMLSLSEIPTPREDADEIVALVKTGGRIVGYKLKSGAELSKEEAVQLAKSGGIKGVGIAKRNGNYYLKSLPDAQEGNNLGNLPSISKEQD